MRRVILSVLGAIFVLLATACGGGGSSTETVGGTTGGGTTGGGTTGGGTTGGGTTGGGTSSPTPSSVTKTAGDNQTAAPGTAVAVAPQVTVLDSAGAPVPGTTVTFSVTAGGGTVAATQATADASGHASPGAWTLGSASGVNSLSATVAALAPVTFSATAALKSTDVTVSVSAPRVNAIIGDSLPVSVGISSTYEIATVTASYADQSATLAGSSGVWTGTLSLTSEPRGTGTLVVTATDVYDHTTQTTVSLDLDRPPTLTVSSPLDGTVAQPNVKITVTCADDDPAGCTTLGASINGKHVADGSTSLSQTVDLSAYEGQTISLLISGFDSVGQRVNVTRTIYVETSTHLTPQSMVTGPVWDVSGTRILYVDVSGTTPSLKILDTATSKTETLETTPDLLDTWGDYGYLTATGAIYVHGPADEASSPLESVYEWRNGALTLLSGSSTVDASDFKVAGTWAIYSYGADGSTPPSLWLRDLTAGTSTLITNDANNNSNDVAANGDVAYGSASLDAIGYNIYRVRAGTALALTNDPYPTVLNTFPLTDGTNIVYVETDGCCSAATTSRLVLTTDGSTKTYLTTPIPGSPQQGSDYAVSNGYVAYLQEDASKNQQVWRHSPTGEQQLTFLGSSVSNLDALGTDGSLVYDQTRRYFVGPGTPTAPPEDIGSLLGRVIYRDGKYFVLIDRTVLLVTP